MKRGRKLSLLLLAAVLIVVTAFFLNKSGLLSDLDSIIAFVESFGSLSYLVFALIVILEVVAAPIPGLILYTAGGILFGTFVGGTIALVGNVIGASIAFFLAKHFKESLKLKVSRKERGKFDKFSEKYGGHAMFFLRVNPLTSSDIFSYLAGITRISFTKFIVGTTLGLAPLIYLNSWVAEKVVLESRFLISLFVALSIAYLLAFVYIIFRTFFKKQK